MIKRLIEHLEEIISVALMAVLLVVLFTQVFTRFVLDAPAVWTEEASRVIFIYLALFGASAAIRTRSHVRIEFFVNYLPWKPRLLLSMVLDVVVVFTLLLLVKLGWETMGRQSMLQMISMPFSMAVFYAGFPVSMLLMAVRLLQRLFADFQDLFKADSHEFATQKPRV